MNDFMQKLAALRSLVAAAPAAVGNAAHAVVSLPGRYMDSVESANQAVDAARQARDDQMIRENFGSPENYARIQAENPVPGPIDYGAALASIGKVGKKAVTGTEDLFARLLGARKGQ